MNTSHRIRCLSPRQLGSAAAPHIWESAGEWRRTVGSAVFLLVFGLIGGGLSVASAAEPTAPGNEKLVAILGGAAPSNIEELRAMQEHVRALTERVIPATVGVEVGAAQGSGVIVSPDGYVLTAAHVIGHSNRDATVFLHDGRRLAARTLGTFRTADAGLLKIDAAAAEAAKLSYVPIGNSTRLALGQWCLATGHPGGIQSAQPDGLQLSRSPTVRLGRIHGIDLDRDHPGLSTDCTLIGGDSGGPLFDMQGQVVGIHSRIAESLTANVHVPIDVFREAWPRLRDGKDWGFVQGRQPFLGVEGEDEEGEARIRRVFPDSPAARAGMREGDVVLLFAGSHVRDFAHLQRYVGEQEPGTKVKMVVLRGNRQLELDIVVARRRN